MASVEIYEPKQNVKGVKSLCRHYKFTLKMTPSYSGHTLLERALFLSQNGFVCAEYLRWNSVDNKPRQRHVESYVL